MANKQLKQQTSKTNQQDQALLNSLQQTQEAEPLHEKYVHILKQGLPHLGKDQDKIIYAQVMLALKLEGIIGKELTDEYSDMVDTIKNSILSDKERTESALLVAERILKQK